MKTANKFPVEIKELTQQSNIEMILKRLEELEALCDQLETDSYFREFSNAFDWA